MILASAHQNDTCGGGPSNYSSGFKYGLLATAQTASDVVGQVRASTPELVVTASLASSAFKGKIEIPGVPLHVPEHSFSVVRLGDRVHLENDPASPWPKIQIDIRESDDHSRSRVLNFRISPSEDSVEGGLLYTRMLFSTIGRPFVIFSQTEKVIEFAPAQYTGHEVKEIEFLASVFRKLYFLQAIFGVTFRLHGEFSKDDTTMTEAIYFGVSRGEAHIRMDEITLPGLKLSAEETRLPPFTDPGLYSRIVTNGHQDLLGVRLPVGPIRLVLMNCELGNKGIIDDAVRGHPVDARFTILDNQTVLRFESFVGPRSHTVAQKLSELRNELLSLEPRELVDLIDGTLQNDVTQFEASQIAIGWLYLNRFTDRYCPQEPIFDEQVGHWRVPVRVVYADGSGGPVGEIEIDGKTGLVVEHTAAEVMRSRGRTIAEQLVHAE